MKDAPSGVSVGGWVFEGENPLGRFPAYCQDDARLSYVRQRILCPTESAYTSPHSAQGIKNGTHRRKECACGHSEIRGWYGGSLQYGLSWLEGKLNGLLGMVGFLRGLEDSALSLELASFEGGTAAKRHTRRGELHHRHYSIPKVWNLLQALLILIGE